MQKETKKIYTEASVSKRLSIAKRTAFLFPSHQEKPKIPRHNVKLSALAKEWVLTENDSISHFRSKTRSEIQTQFNLIHRVGSDSRNDLKDRYSSSHWGVKLASKHLNSEFSLRSRRPHQYSIKKASLSDRTKGTLHTDFIKILEKSKNKERSKISRVSGSLLSDGVPTASVFPEDLSHKWSADKIVQTTKLRGILRILSPIKKRRDKLRVKRVSSPKFNGKSFREQLSSYKKLIKCSLESDSSTPYLTNYLSEQTYTTHKEFVTKISPMDKERQLTEISKFIEEQRIPLNQLLFTKRSFATSNTSKKKILASPALPDFEVDSLFM